MALTAIGESVRPNFKQNRVQIKNNFTTVPNKFLREGGHFHSPLDFMIYMALFSRSYGFGKDTCRFGLTELQRITGMSRNAVRGSLNRLSKQGWITAIDSASPKQLARLWRLNLTVPKNNPVQKSYQEGVRIKHQTGSITELFKEKEKKEKKEEVSFEEMEKEFKLSMGLNAEDYCRNFNDIKFKGFPAPADVMYRLAVRNWFYRELCPGKK